MKTFYKTILLLSLNSLFLGFNSFAQQAPGIEWDRSFGGLDNEFGLSVCFTSDSGYMAAGYSLSSDSVINNNHGQYDFLVVRYAKDGTVIWNKCFGSSNGDIPYKIIKTVDENYIVMGNSEGNDWDVSNHYGGSYPDYWMIKIDSLGNLLWDKNYGGSGSDQGFSVQQTTDNGFILAGYSASNDFDVTGNHGGNDCWIIKTDSVGNIQWQKSLGGSDDERATDIIQTSDGYVMTGETMSNDGDVSGNHGFLDVWVVKLDTVGNIIWQKCFGGSNYDYCWRFIINSAGEYVLAGTTGSNNGDVTLNYGASDFWILKLDSIGNIIWQKSFGGNFSDDAWSIVQNDDKYVILGLTNSDTNDVTGNHGTFDYWLIEVDDLGNLVWQKCFGGSGYDYGRSLLRTNNGNYILFGESDSYDGDISNPFPFGDYLDYWIVKLFPDTITSISNLQTPISNFQIIPNPSNGIFQITLPNFSKVQNFGKVSLEIINTLGQTVFKSQILNPKSQIKLDVSFLPKGIYVLKISDSLNTSSKILIID